MAKFVTNAQNDIDLQATIAYVLAIANDNPDELLTDDIGDEVVAVAAPWIGNNIIRREMHQIFHNLNVDLTFRQNDVIPYARLDGVLNGNSAYYRAQANRVWGAIEASEGGLEKITTYRQEAGKGLIANANHRDLEELHNWYTNNQNIDGTSTCRLLACGGSGIERFKAYMGIFGHDMWHYMSDSTLRRCAHMLAGGVCERVDTPDADGGEVADEFHNMEGDSDTEVYGEYVTDATGMKYRPNGPVVLENFRVGETLYRRITIDEVIDVGQAAKDRFPGNMVGISGLITGVQAITSMITSVASVVSITQVDNMIGNYNLLLSKITAPGMNRTALLELKDALQSIISFAYGYCQESPELRDHTGKYSSLASYANRASDQLAFGSIFARRIRELTTDPNAVEGLIRSALASVSNAVVAAAQVEDFDADEAEFAEIGPENVRIYRNADQINNEKDRRTLALQLEAMTD
eukprot:3430_1